VDQDEDYERAVLRFAEECVTDRRVADAMEAAVASTAGTTRTLTLGARLLQLTLPGVPDVYQGTEVVSRTLVDPDNRRPVDFAAIRDRLRRLDEGAAPRTHLDDEKLLLTATVLRLRRRNPGWFDGTATYEPLDLPEPLVGFVRGRRLVTIVRRDGRPVDRDDADEVASRLPADGERWRDLLPALPVTLLVRVAGSSEQRSSLEVTP
jgi:(1->4)-alpha-D-glucan 1-alpha-D-glucosylmutase